MKSLSALRWFPQKGYEVQVFYHPYELHYEITILKYDIADSLAPSTHIEETHVHLSTLANSVAEFIEKAKQLPTC